jgi:dephospho-CoA kinase
VRRSLAVAVTGGIGCGKSEAGEVLRRLGVDVVDADDLARRHLEPGEPVFESVVETFGRGILGEGGRIDRAALAERVFSSAGELKKLNAAVHPAVLRDIGDRVGVARRERRDVAVIVPLLFEAGAADGWDAIVCVAASPGLAARRLEAKGYTAGMIRKRTAAQMPVDEKIRRSDFVIWNDGSLDDLERETRKVWKEIGERSSGDE